MDECKLLALVLVYKVDRSKMHFKNLAFSVYINSLTKRANLTAPVYFDFRKLSNRRATNAYRLQECIFVVVDTFHYLSGGETYVIIFVY